VNGGEWMNGLGGASGWAGAGLLGLVLAWLLLKHLPLKDEQLERMHGSHKAEMVSAITAQRADFRESLTQIMQVHEREVSGIINALHKDLETLSKAVEALERTVSSFERRRSPRGEAS
jgi:hypothetical protein